MKETEEDVHKAGADSTTYPKIWRTAYRILVRSPVKSLLRFRCVCESWNALISSQRFIDDHLARNPMANACHYLLIKITVKKARLSLFCAKTLASCSDVMNFPIHKKTGYSASGFYGSFKEFSVIGSCNGLLCVSNTILWDLGIGIYLWNPSIRKFKRVPKGLISTRTDGSYLNVVAVGFGFNCEQNDYKVVRIVACPGTRMLKAEVYSLKSDYWRRISAVVLPISNCCNLDPRSAYLNGVVFWIGEDAIFACYVIITFDLSSETLQMIKPPNELTLEHYNSVRIQVFEQSLFLMGMKKDDRTYDIWVLEVDTWKNLGTICLPQCGHIRGTTSGVTSNGGIYIAKTRSEKRECESLVLHDPHWQQGKEIKLSSDACNFYLYAYQESLISPI